MSELARVVMPAMGESITEGTVAKWHKRVGERVERDETLLEVSTDKVEAEIPSPIAGRVAEILVPAGQTVPIQAVLATIEPEVDSSVSSATHRAPEPTSVPCDGQGPKPSKTSPVVRRIAREHDVDLSQVHGTGPRGRITKADIVAYLETQSVPASVIVRLDPTIPAVVHSETPSSTPAANVISSRAPTGPVEGDDVRPLSNMRKAVAAHMILSRRTSAHVHSVFHVDFSAVERFRRQRNQEFQRVGVRLTLTSLIATAVVEVLCAHPILNASIQGEHVLHSKHVNLGIAVALADGLVVPVIPRADEKSLIGLARAIADVAERARAKRLSAEDVTGGTFTITNPGQFGAQFGLPIIHQPQSAILGVGTVEPRPVVVDNALGIRPMGYLALGFDHRLIDGAVADHFMADVKRYLEAFSDRATTH